MSLLRPISSLNPWQKCRLRDKHTNLYMTGYIVVGHDISIAQTFTATLESGYMHGAKLDPTKFKFEAMPGATVVACQGQHRGAMGWRFYTVPSATMVELDE